MDSSFFFIIWGLTSRSFSFIKGQYGQLKTQNNSYTKVQLMQTNNWLANNYHFSIFFFIFLLVMIETKMQVAVVVSSVLK